MKMMPDYLDLSNKEFVKLDVVPISVIDVAVYEDCKQMQIQIPIISGNGTIPNDSDTGNG